MVYRANFCHLFSLTDEIWLDGPMLPGTSNGPVVVPFDNTFLSIGGSIDDKMTPDIYQFDPENLKWIKRREKLSVPRFPGYAFAFE